MKNVWPLQDQVFWYLKRGEVVPCREDRKADVAIIGGGIAGLSAAQAFSKRGKNVVLLEQYYCGSGASGKSSGFVTPNAELSFTDFSKRYNKEIARTIWDFITSGVNDIRNNIQHHTIACDYLPQDTLVVANSKRDLTILETEYHNLIESNYKAAFYAGESVQDYIGSQGYYGGVRYEDSFSMDAYAYCQAMKKQLASEGVLIFEDTPVTSLNDHTLITPQATITADYIIVCCDRFLPNLGLLKQDVYHAQTYIMLSSQLTDDQARLLFPQDKLLVWDTDLIYNYFRLTHDNRLLMGGGNLLTTYSAQENHNYKPIVTKLTNYLGRKFPELSLQFEHMWPGLIGLSKDIAPLAGSDKDAKHIYYVAAAAGLPIAAALGRYSAEHLLDGNTALDAYFSPYRPFPIGGIVQSVLGTKITFALSNLLKSHVP
jgi:gamma-glutamylputrescine oxidase